VEYNTYLFEYLLIIFKLLVYDFIDILHIPFVDINYFNRNKVGCILVSNMPVDYILYGTLF
jgi:hypothetical protein